MSATDDRGEGTRTAVLGTGIMGSAMARNLLRAGLQDDGMGPVRFRPPRRWPRRVPRSPGRLPTRCAMPG